MALRTRLVADDVDLAAVLALQRANFEQAVGAAEASAQGFVTVVHTPEILRAMHALAPSVVAVDENDAVVGYALVMPREARALLPVLAPMFAKLDVLLPSARYYVMGQVCVAKAWRGRGVVDALYAAHRAHYAARFDVVVTEVAVRNARSVRAHARVGFRELARYTDATDTWSIIAWPLT